MVPPGAQRELSVAQRELSGAQRELSGAQRERERERELFGAQKGPSRAQGAPLPRAVYRGFVTTGVLFGLVRVG